MLVVGEHVQQQDRRANGEQQVDDEDDSAGDHTASAMEVRDDRQEDGDEQFGEATEKVA